MTLADLATKHASPARYCAHCEEPLVRRKRESAATFARKRYCDKVCYERSRDPHILSRGRIRAGSAFAMLRLPYHGPHPWRTP